MPEHTEPSRDTVAEERAEAGAPHSAPQRPDPAQADAAEQAEGEVIDEVGQHYKEMTEKGAKVKGEGQIG